SGKSSLIRALKTLLERKPDADPVMIQAQFDDHGQRVEGRALANHRSWRIDGEDADRPDWPEAEALDAYLIRADDLVDPGRSEAAISAALKQTLSGGVDLDGLLERKPFRLPPRPFGTARKLDAINTEIRRLEQRYASIADQVDGLDDLRAEHVAATAAERRLALLARAREWLDIQQLMHETRAQLEQLPLGLDKLTGREADQLDAIEQERLVKQRQLETHQRDLRRANQDLTTLSMDDVDQAQSWRDDLDEIKAQLNKAADRLHDYQERRSGALARLQLAAQRSGGLEKQSIRTLSPDDLQTIHQRVDAVIKEQTRANELRDAIDLSTHHQADPARAQAVDEAIKHLRAWLAAAVPSPVSWIVWTVLLLAAGAGAAWCWQEQRMNWAMLCGVVGLMPLSHLLQLVLRSGRGGRLRRAVLALAIDPPEQWQRDPVQARLRELENERAALDRHADQAKAAEVLALKLEKSGLALSELQAELAQVAADVGLNPDALIRAEHSLRLHNLADWQQADREVHELDSSIRAAESGIHGLLGTAQRCIRRLEPDQTTPIDAGLLDSTLKRVDRRLHQARELRQKIHALKQSLEQTQADLHSLGRRRLTVFEQAELDQDDPIALQQRLERLDDYKAASSQLRGLEATAQSHRLALAADPELTERVTQHDEAALESMQSELQARADRREAIKDRMAEIEHAHQQATRERALETLLAEREFLTAQLTVALDEQRLAAAGQYLIQRVQQQQHQQHQPTLLKRATHWFSRFTHHRYELKFDGQRFSAMDHRQGQRRGIAELSTATRVQLKLALRLAWVDQLDRHRPTLPLFLDEVLATSDPERYRAVVEAAQELVRDGRQVVYLSAQPMDAQAWQHHGGDPAPQIIQLGTTELTSSLEFNLPEAEPLPDPSLSPEDWALAAGVAAIDPWQPDERMDLFHLLRDQLSVLSTLRARDLRTVGQLQHALDQGLLDAVDNISTDELRARVSAAHAWLQRWRRGQTPPVELNVLTESGLVSNTYIEKMTAAVEQVGGRADALISALRDAKNKLRVPGFGPMKIDALETWLGDHGYLTDVEPAQAHELIDALIQAGPLSDTGATALHRSLLAGLKI
ncbi:MAG: hypothetical protein AAGH65_03720, partial [Pseudomonadota bacterium]